MFAKASNTSLLLFIDCVRAPPHRLPWGNVWRSKRVTMPKLLLPPLSARQRSGRAAAFALTMAPDARTIYGCQSSNIFEKSIRAGNPLQSSQRYRMPILLVVQSRRYHLQRGQVNIVWTSGKRRNDWPPRVNPPTPTAAFRPPATAIPWPSK